MSNRPQHLWTPREMARRRGIIKELSRLSAGGWSDATSLEYRALEHQLRGIDGTARDRAQNPKNQFSKRYLEY